MIQVSVDSAAKNVIEIDDEAAYARLLDKMKILLWQGVEMLAEVAAVSPQEYERQQKDDLASSGGVRNTAKFVEALADRSASQAAACLLQLCRTWAVHA